MKKSINDTCTESVYKLLWFHVDIIIIELIILVIHVIIISIRTRNVCLIRNFLMNDP